MTAITASTASSPSTAPTSKPPLGFRRKRGSFPQALGRSRGGRTTKLHGLTDAKGRPRVLLLTASNVSDITVAADPARTIGPFRRLIADRGYDADHRDIFRETSYANMPNVAIAAALAARLSRRTKLQYAALKFRASMRTCSLPFVDTDPSRGRRSGVENEKANHVLFAQAIASAYSVLEEIGFEVRASQQKPAAIDGMWNPSIRADLEQRLCDGGINLSDDEMWLARGPKTRLEKKRVLPSGLRASWSLGCVRDQHVAVIDASARASWLRSKVSSHRFSELVPSLTAIDVVNVQFLARRLLLEHVGFLPGTKG